MNDHQIDLIMAQVRKELEVAVKMHGPMNSPHEGWAVIKEELDELWEHCRANTGDKSEARKEAL